MAACETWITATVLGNMDVNMERRPGVVAGGYISFSFSIHVRAGTLGYLKSRRILFQ